MKLGFFGGSFNPPTIAHYNLIKQALKEYNFDKVYFVPVNDYYKKHLEGIPGIKFFPETEWAKSACWFSGVVLDNTKDVREVCEQLAAKGIQTRPFWKPVYMQRPYKDAEKSSINVTEKMWKHILTLPSSTGLTEIQLESIICALREIL